MAWELVRNGNETWGGGRGCVCQGSGPPQDRSGVQRVVWIIESEKLCLVHHDWLPGSSCEFEEEKEPMIKINGRHTSFRNPNNATGVTSGTQLGGRGSREAGQVLAGGTAPSGDCHHRCIGSFTKIGAWMTGLEGGAQPTSGCEWVFALRSKGTG